MRIIYALLIIAMLFAPHVPFFGAQMAYAALRTNMSAWYELNEESGTRVDAHNSNDLTDNNTVLFGTGIVGNAADFEVDNANEYLSVADTADLSITGDGTLAYWVNRETAANAYIISKQSTNDNISYNSRIINDKPRFAFFTNLSTRSEFTSTSVTIANTGQWYCVVWTWDVSVPSAILYIDSTAVADTEDDTSATSIQDSNATFTVGALDDAGDIINEVDGLIDNVVVVKAIWTQTNVNDFCNSGAGISYADSAEAAVVPKRPQIINWLN